MAKNYGDFLLKTIESAKDKFTEDELKTLKSGAEKIREIEKNKLTKIEEKYPDAVQKSKDGNTSVPATSDMTASTNNDNKQKFPSFEGKDLDGNDVKRVTSFSHPMLSLL